MSPVAPVLPEGLEQAYEALALLGRGGMGRVLRVRRRSDGRELALKLMLEAEDADEVSPERFRLEADLARRRLHRDLVGIVDSGTCDGSGHYLVMELVHGRTLRAELADGRPMSRTRTLELGTRLADVLGALHEAGVVHRDLKPENVMLEPGGRVRLLDLGIARDTMRTAQLTAEGILLGTPAFMAPEVCRGQSPGPPADVFALGVLLLDCLSPTDPLPHTAKDRLGLLAARAAGRELLTPHHGLDAPLRALLLRLMDPNPDDRPANGRAALTELTSLPPAPSSPAAARTRRMPRPALPSAPLRRRRRLPGLVLLALTAFALASLRLLPLAPAATAPASTTATASDPALVSAYRSRLEDWLQDPTRPLPDGLRRSGLAPDGALQDMLYRRLLHLTEFDLTRALSDGDLASCNAAFLGLVDLAASAEPPPPVGTELDAASAFFAMQYAQALPVREQVITRERILTQSFAAASAAEQARLQLLHLDFPRTVDLLHRLERLRQRTEPRNRRLVLDLAYATLLRRNRLLDEAREFLARQPTPCPPGASPAVRLEAILWLAAAAALAASENHLRAQGEHAAAAMVLAPRWSGDHMSLAERAALETARDHIRGLLDAGLTREALDAAAVLLEGRDDERYRPHLRLKLAEIWESRGDAATARRLAAGESLQGP